jgi:predicted nuclease of restriction endonuclease-like RecB superfamily
LLVDHERFELEVRCRMRSGERHLHAASPILLPKRTMRRPGYRVAQRLARGLEALGYTVESEPAPLITARQIMLFPDLAVEHAGVRVLVDIIGFSTEDYLGHRLAQYREAGAGVVILCVDATRVGDQEQAGDPSDRRVLRYARSARAINRRPLDPAAVIEAIDALVKGSR